MVVFHDFPDFGPRTAWQIVASFSLVSLDLGKFAKLEKLGRPKQKSGSSAPWVQDLGQATITIRSGGYVPGRAAKSTQLLSGLFRPPWYPACHGGGIQPTPPQPSETSEKLATICHAVRGPKSGKS
ncbi:MAG: hypothetical protein GY938_10855 [Ketobacter sp.]|nr:hypothetical protein [Ketobacter sp.]